MHTEQPHTNVTSPLRSFAVVLVIILIVLSVAAAGCWYVYRTWIAPHVSDATQSLQDTAESVKAVGVQTKESIDAGVKQVQTTVDAGVNTVNVGINEAQETAKDIKETKDALDTLTEKAGTIFKTESEE